MGVVSDSLKELLKQLEENDKRMQERLDRHLTRTSKLLDSLNETLKE